MSDIDLDYLQQWVGRTDQRSAIIDPVAPAKLAATLDCPEVPTRPGDALPPAWHWLYLHDVVMSSSLGSDGHPAKGGFLPPVPLPRRMWAAGRLTFHEPVLLGDTVTRHSSVDSVQLKQGGSGELVFVSISHRIMRGDVCCIEEVQDLVYRDITAYRPLPADAPSSLPGNLQRSFTPDPVTLFRYSALTFNSHRIHYDNQYATAVEGYPALVVQGPLTVTLLLDLLRREKPEAQLAELEFRSRGPLFVGQAMELGYSPSGDGIELYAVDPNGALAMHARAKFK